MSANKGVIVVFSIALVYVISPVPSFANMLPSYSKQTHTYPRHSYPALTQTQKEVLEAADAVFALARASARNGFELALADAKAIRDQALASAGKDKIAIEAANESFRSFGTSISQDYKLALKTARAIRQNALAEAHIPITAK
ncbi:MAG TPA: hypothetical protein VMV42_00080 [archaeon]|nr:hypothetical protein [archaeon]